MLHIPVWLSLTQKSYARAHKPLSPFLPSLSGFVSFLLDLSSLPLVDSFGMNGIRLSAHGFIFYYNIGEETRLSIKGGEVPDSFAEHLPDQYPRERRLHLKRGDQLNPVASPRSPRSRIPRVDPG